MKLISIVTACYNEEENVEDLHAQIVQVMSELPQYRFEHIYIDNASTDRTVPILRRLAAADRRVKVILNARNFGHIRSPYHALLQATGDAVISIAADLQDPPSLIKEFTRKWEEGFKVVMGVKAHSQETWLFFMLRKLYYRVLGRLSEVRLVENFTGCGLYDQQVVEILRKIDDPYPYFRGLIADIGFEAAKIEFVQPARKRGITKNNLYTLYDMAMVGFTNNTKMPLRLATMVGFLTAAISFLIGLFYFVYKLIYWQSFTVGLAPLVVGLFFFGGIQLFFLGIVAEYVGAIYTQVQHRPLVIEKERINFGSEDH
ncbi:MAG: glycosyltransferase family 2 protein [Chloroflexi bacterium]|nr:glycosyltransferase family 2 protein [Chloroflexota bacterium]